MADRYWVGGTANWDATAGTKWATVDGGAGGAAVPTTADDVYFTAASGVVTVTITTTAKGRNIDFTGFTGTLTGTSGIDCYGSLTAAAGMTWTQTGVINFWTLSGGVFSKTITSAGKTFGSITIPDSAQDGVSVSLADALSLTGALTIARVTFTTNNFNVTATQIVSVANTVRTLNLGSSTITLSGTVAFNLVGSLTSLTINAGTSTINATASGAQITTGGQITPQFTFYNLNFTSTATGTHIISGGFTFNDISVAGPASAGVVGVTLTGITINGTLSTTGTAGNRRVWFRGITYGIAQTLTINSAPSLTDADFRDIYVIGTAAPISGTRIGDLRGIRGITASTPKTVYWNLSGAQNWSADGWATTSTGTPSTDNFPLAQDTATFTDAGSVTGTITMNTAIPYTGTVDMSGRTSAMTLGVGGTPAIYGNWKNGSGTTLFASAIIIFSGRNTQTITSAGKTFSQSLTVDSYGGSVELADALNISGNTIFVTNGTFDTKGYNVTAGTLSSSNSNVREIKLGSSTVTLSATSSVLLSTTTNLTFNAGTSQLNLSSGGDSTLINSGGVTFYNVFLTVGIIVSHTISGNNTFNNLTTISGPTGVKRLIFSGNQIITGTFTCSGASAIRRIFIASSTVGTPRTLTVGTLSADNCDFRDITIAGTAAGSSPTRAGDCGGNSGVTFPAAKTVYWNLAGSQNWSATGWALSSGGPPNINNFPLAQDTVVFDNTGAAGTVTMNAASVWNIGTFDASARTSAMTLTIGNTFPSVYGNWTFGTGVTSSSSAGTIVFSGHGSSTITSNGVTFGCRIEVASPNRTLQLADALSLISTNYLRVSFGEFNAGIYNCTMGSFDSNNSNIKTVKMGSGTWTLTDAASPNTSVWGISATNTSFYKGTANIVLSNTSTTARIFTGGGLSYNKLTIGGATGTSTLTIAGNNQFTELDSTKTVAHTIALGTTVQTFGKWSVTGTAGNVVTLTGTGTTHQLVGACTNGIDYLAMGSIGFAATSPAEFYAGANSTGTAAAPVYRTAKPADSVRYWVGGTGNWSDANKWSTSSGGAGGADLPRSHDDVVFDSASNATAYTATVNAITGGNRCKALTIAGPASGNVTLAGSTPLFIHDDITLPATGLTRTYTGTITLPGTGVGKTITTNGVALSSTVIVNGVGAEWALADALNIGNSPINIINGIFDTGNFNLTSGSLTSTNANDRTIILGSSTVTLNGSGNTFNAQINTNLTFNAGTSSVVMANASFNILAGAVGGGAGLTFYNVSAASTAITSCIIRGANTFNDLTVAGRISGGVSIIAFDGDQTINGTLTLSAGTNATMRTFVRSDTIGTTRTLTCAAVGTLTDIDFRDITIAGAAAPVSGTRLGDCKGNSGITFDAAKTVYKVSGTVIESTNGFATSSGGAGDTNNFPLAQDTAIWDNLFPNSGDSILIGYNLGTIDMSARTSAMTLTCTNSLTSVYGNWINGTGVTLSGTGTMTFAGRGSQTITSAGVTFTQAFDIETPNGSVTLQDAFETNRSSTSAFNLQSGTFDANNYNVTLSGVFSNFGSSNFETRTIAIGSGTWTIAGSGAAWNTGTVTNLTVTGTGTISLTSASTKTFSTGNFVSGYAGITINQGSTGQLNLNGFNTFANITSTATGATTINFGTTTQRVANFTATGTAGNVLTLQGTSATSPGTLILTSGTVTTPDYLNITGLRAYDLSDTWYAGANSTNNGSLGWIFESGVVGASTIFYGANNITSIFYGSTPVSAIYYGAAQVF